MSGQSNFEEEEYILFNDIEKIEEDEAPDLDVSGLFELQKLNISPELTSYIYDLKEKISKKDYINLSLKPTIKLHKYKYGSKDILKTKKLKNLNLKNYKPKKDFYTIDIRDIELFYKESGPYADIHKPYLPLHGMMYVSSLTRFKKFIKKIKTNTLYLYKFVGTIVLFIVFIFGYKNILEYRLLSTFDNISKISQEQNIVKLGDDLIDIRRDIVITNLLLQPVYLFNYFLNIESINNLSNILSGSRDVLSGVIDIYIIGDRVMSLVESRGVDDIMFSEVLKNIEPNLSKILQDIHDGLDKFYKIETLGDEDLDNKFITGIGILEEVKNSLEKFILNVPNIQEILGSEERKTYMIVFQNRDEIRPTGGFMGSVGFVSLFKGRLVDFETQDIYALEWNLKDHSEGGVAFREPAPEGINRLTPTFGLRDSNYFWDLERSSNEIKKHIDKLGYSLNGIVYINQGLVADSLERFGSVFFNDYDIEITGDNFSYVMSSLVESKTSHTHTLGTPKQVLFDFIEDYKEEFKKRADYRGYIEFLFNAITSRDILVHFFNDDLNKLTSEIGLINDYNFKDYFDFNFPFFTSISGNKSDRYMRFNFNKSVNRLDNCNYETSLDIRLRHTFSLRDEATIRNFMVSNDIAELDELEYLIDIQGRGQNRQFVRVLIPRNAIVHNVANYIVRNYEDYKELGFYMITDRLSNSNRQITYTIPNLECKDYNYNFTKQPGLREYSLEFFKNDIMFDNLNLRSDYIFYNR